jgi:hypothetical protein
LSKEEGIVEKISRVANTLTLSGILAVLILILVRLPRQYFPTLKDLQEAKSNRTQTQKLLMEMPIVRVEEVRGTVDVDVTNSELSVTINNTPLDATVNN